MTQDELIEKVRERANDRTQHVMSGLPGLAHSEIGLKTYPPATPAVVQDAEKRRGSAFHRFLLACTWGDRRGRPRPSESCRQQALPVHWKRNWTETTV